MGRHTLREAICRIDAPHYCAGAVWQHTGEEWKCVQAAPIIQWMEGKPPSYVKEYLDSKGYKWEWLKRR